MRVLLTGASGFIGSHVLRALIHHGHSVAALAIPGDPLWRIRDALEGVWIVRGTLSGLHELSRLLSAWRPEGCIHLAWYVEPGKYLHAQENIQCLMESLQLFRAAAEWGCDGVVAAGTCAEHDITADSPGPPTMYAAAKLACGLLGRAVAEGGGMRFAWARIFYPYGPYDDERRALPTLIRALLSGEPFPATQGNQVRDCVHVEDIAAAFVLLLEKGESGVFDVASGAPVKVRELMESVGRVWGRPELIQFGALPDRPGDPSGVGDGGERLRALGWAPRYSLEEGVRQTVEWWRRLPASGGAP